METNNANVRICFVCLGNICRSPTAEGVMQHLVVAVALSESIEIDSSGTAAYHSGERADARARATARGRGMTLTSIARQFDPSDFEHFDYVVAMDRANRRELLTLAANPEQERKVHLLRDFDPAGKKGVDVPDPYYGGARGFEDVFDICEAGCRGLLDHVVRVHGLRGD